MRWAPDIGRDVEPGAQAIAEARLLDREIGPESGDLALDRNDGVIDAVERMPEIGREIAQHIQRRRRMFGDFLGNAVQGVEQGVRIELQAQLLEFGPQGIGLGAHGSALLCLPRHLRAQPEVGEAPPHEGKEVMHEWDEKLFDAAATGRHDPRQSLMNKDDRACDDQGAQQREQADQRHAADRHATGKGP